MRFGPTLDSDSESEEDSLAKDTILIKPKNGMIPKPHDYMVKYQDFMMQKQSEIEMLQNKETTELRKKLEALKVSTPKPVKNNSIGSARTLVSSYTKSCFDYWSCRQMEKERESNEASARKAKEDAEKKKEEQIQKAAEKDLKNKIVEEKPAAAEQKSIVFPFKPPDIPLKNNLMTNEKLKSSPGLESVPKPADISKDESKIVQITNEAVKDVERNLNLIQEMKKYKKTIIFNNSLVRLKMKINKTVGQLTSDNATMIRLIKEFHNIFNNSEKELLFYITAKKIVKQSELEVSVRKESAFPLALLCVYLTNKFPGCGDYIIGRILFKNQFLIPKVDQSNYTLGRKSSESSIQYNERMIGISTLYFAIIQTDKIANSYTIDYGWKWISRYCDLPPSDITPLLLQNFFEIAGHTFLEKYGQQAMKIVNYVMDKIIKTCPKSAVASTTKLQLYIEETVYVSNKFPRYKGSDFK